MLLKEQSIWSGTTFVKLTFVCLLENNNQKKYDLLETFICSFLVNLSG